RFSLWHHFASSEGGGTSSGIGAASTCASFSVSSLLGLKPASRFAAMVMVCPVRGLRPWRSFRSFTTKLPKPRRSTRSFACSASAIIARTESTATSTSAFFNSVLAATFSINCGFVILFKFSGFRSPKRQPASRGCGGLAPYNPYPSREPGSDNPHPSQTGVQGIHILHGKRRRGQEGGPSWYFRGLPLVLDVFPGMSRAGREPEARKYIYNTGATVNLSSGRDNAARSRFGCFFALRNPVRSLVRRMVPRDSGTREKIYIFWGRSVAARDFPKAVGRVSSRACGLDGGKCPGLGLQRGMAGADLPHITCDPRPGCHCGGRFECLPGKPSWKYPTLQYQSALLWRLDQWQQRVRKSRCTGDLFRLGDQQDDTGQQRQYRSSLDPAELHRQVL